MINIKPILYGNFIDLEVWKDDEWVDGELVEGGFIKAGKAIVMPWNTQKDTYYIEIGNYTIDDRKAYSYEKLHVDDNETTEIKIGETYYKMKYMKDYNEASIYFYGLKKFVKT